MTDKFIRWTSSDDEGSFSYVGRIIPNEKGQFPGFSMETEFGIMRIPSNDGTVEVITKPKNFKIRQNTSSIPLVPHITKPKKVTKKGSKKERALEIYREFKDRELCIEQFMSQLDMSKAGASTYYYNCKKANG